MIKKIHKYIFISAEGYTFQPDFSKESIGDEIENAQVIGFSYGKNEDEAFKNLTKEYDYLIYSNFNEVICYQLDDEYEKKTKGFCLKELKNRNK